MPVDVPRGASRNLRPSGPVSYRNGDTHTEVPSVDSTTWRTHGGGVLVPTTPTRVSRDRTGDTKDYTDLIREGRHPSCETPSQLPSVGPGGFAECGKLFTDEVPRPPPVTPSSLSFLHPPSSLPAPLDRSSLQVRRGSSGSCVRGEGLCVCTRVCVV